MREETEFRPKPMVEIGGAPVVWHIMQNLSHGGIDHFVVAAGYKANVMKTFFANLRAFQSDLSTDLATGNVVIHEESGDLWRMHGKVDVVDTGMNSPTGERLRRLQRWLSEDELFIVTYGDGLADVDVRRLIKYHQEHGKEATVTVARPVSRFGVTRIDAQGNVVQFSEKPTLDTWVNIGYFVFNKSIFSKICENEVLEVEPLKRLVDEGELAAYRHNRFWMPMDTYREYQELNALWESGNAPWKTW